MRGGVPGFATSLFASSPMLKEKDTTLAVKRDISLLKQTLYTP